ncbi:MAG: hypothetical protein JNM00_09560 [Flavobacteriales bacterium]|nr:hypothetical protein [Flavobacteriales bacterium]
MNKSIVFLGLIGAILALSSCKKDEPEPPAPSPKLIFRFAFDPNQERLDNFGNPSTLPAGHAAQSPEFRAISAHYVELTPNALTWLGDGEVLYDGPETDAGGAMAIDFSQSIVVDEGENFLALNLSDLQPGTYPFIRVSLAYQNYDIDFLQSGLDLTGTVASFIGYNTYISSYNINTQTIAVNDDRLQGYWGFETDVLGTPYTTTGQAPEGATTVPNPLWDTSPIPAGSCVVTGEFAEPLVITGNETSDIVVTLSLSTNQSFEWVDTNPDGKYEPAAGENVVDMGIRGLVPVIGN